MFIRFVQRLIHVTDKFFYTSNKGDPRGRPIQHRENLGEQPFHRNEICKIIVSDVNEIKLAPTGIPSNLDQCFLVLGVEAWDYQAMTDKRQFTLKEFFIFIGAMN